MIAIPNMEKPERCGLCNFCKWTGKWECIIKHKAEWFHKYEGDNYSDCPLIDIVPCKECKWWEKFEGGIWEEVEGEYGFCTLRVDGYKPFGEDNFCSYGERRTDENTD